VGTRFYAGWRGTQLAVLTIIMRTNQMSFARVALGSLAAVAMTAGVAAADDRSLLEGRDGATFGVGVGAGHIGCSDSNGNDCNSDDNEIDAGGISFRAGVMISPYLALAADLWAMGRTEDDVTVSQGIAAATLRGWATPRFWLQGGVGVARSAAEVDLGADVEVMSETDYVPAAVAGIGYELISTDLLALDLELKAGTGLYEDDIQVYNLSLGAGVSFY
jgi:hypothetical protein